MTRRLFLAILLVGLLPASALAATLESHKNVVLNQAPLDNTYLAGSDVRVAAPVAADLTAAAGTLTIAAPVTGDALLAGGTIDIEKSITGDLRAVGGRIIIPEDVGGDVAVAGGIVLVSGHAHDVQAAGGTVRVMGGADTDVTIYGSDVTLSGEYGGDVRIVASDRITIGDNAHIHGALSYNAPQQIDIPASTTVEGGVTYVGASSFLPSSKEVRTFQTVGVGVFILVKIIAALVAAGLITGLFPIFSNRIMERMMVRKLRPVVLLGLLGFAIAVASPLLIFFLLVSFVGIGLALILLTVYVLLIMLAYIYAGLYLGTALLRYVTKRSYATWKEAIVGMILLYLIGVIPYVGGVLVFVLCAIAGGAIARVVYAFAFIRDTDDV
jgi:hypothetical protein